MKTNCVLCVGITLIHTCPLTSYIQALPLASLRGSTFSLITMAVPSPTRQVHIPQIGFVERKISVKILLCGVMKFDCHPPLHTHPTHTHPYHNLQSMEQLSLIATLSSNCSKNREEKFSLLLCASTPYNIILNGL